MPSGRSVLWMAVVALVVVVGYQRYEAAHSAAAH